MDAQSRNKWKGELRGQPANPGSPGKMAVKTEFVCVMTILGLHLIWPVYPEITPGSSPPVAARQ